MKTPWTGTASRVAFAALFAFLCLPLPVNAADEPPPTCERPMAIAQPPGNLKLTVSTVATSVWQPRRGEVRFSIRGTGFSPENAIIIACFRWRDAGKNAQWFQSPALRLTDNPRPAEPAPPAGTFFFAAAVPNLPNAPAEFFPRISGDEPDKGAYTGLGVVPVADFRVIAIARGGTTPAPAWTPLDIVLPVGVSSVWFAVASALGILIGTWVALVYFARRRNLPGRRNWILDIVTTRNGYASLSQLQIILWSFVIGGSAIYVMALSGNLIDISSGALALLGITGVSTVASKLQSNQAETAGRSTVTAPGAVSALAVHGSPTDTEIRLVWGGPTGGGPPVTYCVQYREVTAGGNPPGPWETATTRLRRPGFRLINLKPATTYDAQVFAVNEAGPGAPADIASIQTAAAAPAPPGLSSVTRLRATEDVTNTSIKLTWAPDINAQGYIVQYRRHDSDDDWTRPTNLASPEIKISGLDASTLYDIRVAPTSSQQGASPSVGPWAAIVVATLGPRVPRWSDLVVTGDGEDEIDVTRVQMLFFTVIAALFVALRVIVSGEIPGIPENFLLLMGISNGVYLTAKFMGR